MSVEVNGEVQTAQVEFSKFLMASLVKDAYFQIDPKTGALIRRDFGAASVAYLFLEEQQNEEKLSDLFETFTAGAAAQPNKQGVAYTFLLIGEKPFTQSPYATQLEAALAQTDAHGVLADIVWINIADGTAFVLGNRTPGDKKLGRVLKQTLKTWCLPKDSKEQVQTELKDSLKARSEALRPRIRRRGPNPVLFLILINVALFVGGWILEARTGTDWFVAWGIQDNALIWAGEIWRLFTSMFLHADLAHLGGNMLFLYMLGRSLYPHYGNGTLWGMYLFSGLVGNLAGLFFTDYLSLGASGAIMGLGGVLIYRMIWGKEAKAFRYGGNFASLAIMIGYNLIYGLFTPGIDNYGHFGGFLGGILVAVLVAWQQNRKHRTQ